MNKQQNPKRMNFQNKITEIYDSFMLIEKKHIHLHLQLRYIKNSHINASTWINNNIIVLSSGAIQKLTVSDITALLCHECGHLKQKPWQIISVLSSALVIICCGLLSIKAILYVIICTCLLTAKVYRTCELRADRYSSQIVGKQQYIHLLKSIRKFSARQHTNNKIMVASFSSMPFEYIKCQFWLWCYYFYNIMQKLNIMSLHPTYNKRIKNIERYEA